MIDLNLLQCYLNKKTKDNEKYGKTYFLDKDAMAVIKIKPNSYSKLEYDCIKWFCKYYKNTLKLNFKVYKKDDKIITVSPIVDVIYNNFFTENELLKNTYLLLDDFIKQNQDFKEMLITQELKVKVYIDQLNPNNFFIFNNEIYLLDLETFYFCIYTDDGYNIGMFGINEDWERIIKPYKPEINKYKKHNLQDNMLIY